MPSLTLLPPLVRRDIPRPPSCHQPLQFEPISLLAGKPGADRSSFPRTALQLFRTGGVARETDTGGKRKGLGPPSVPSDANLALHWAPHAAGNNQPSKHHQPGLPHPSDLKPRQLGSGSQLVT